MHATSADAPPAEWFADPQLCRPTPLTVTDAGRIYGHLATWGTEHTGRPGIRPTRSASGYGFYLTGAVRCAGGRMVPVGSLTLSGGHAWPLEMDPLSAACFYDRTASTVADLTVGEDAHGIWITGALRPGVTPVQLRVLRASAPSGDWRVIDGKAELVGICQVNVPGFPVPRVQVPVPVPAEPALPRASLLERLERLERTLGIA